MTARVVLPTARARSACRAQRVQVEGEVQESEYGTFGWVMDPEGNKLELWQPPAGQ